MAIDDKYESIKRDILKREPLPSVEAAYATIRREVARLNILKPASSSDADTSLGSVLAWQQKYRETEADSIRDKQPGEEKIAQNHHSDIGTGTKKTNPSFSVLIVG